MPLKLYADIDTVTELEARIEMFIRDEIVGPLVSKKKDELQICGIPVIYLPVLDGLSGEGQLDDIMIVSVPDPAL